MFEKEAEECVPDINWHAYSSKEIREEMMACYRKGAEKANEWHEVKNKLPEMGKFVFVWTKTNDFPIVARRVIPYGQKEWVWDCKWGSGFMVSQSAGADYLWKEIVLPTNK